MSVSPPRPKLPNLNAMRAFEAAARLNSISAAANELCVTPAAVAQQVKTLEAWVGQKLFRRRAQGVELTPLGAGVLVDFSTAFDAMAAAVQKLRMQANPHEVRIATLPSIAQLWVSPRLPAIRAALPDVSISVTATEQPPNLRREPFDLAIFFGESDGSDNCRIISDDVIFPVCAPLVAKRIGSVDDLARETFLHDTTWKNDWSVWLSAASPQRNLNKAGPQFSLYSLAVEECKNGAGVLIGHEALVRSQIEAGNLVAPLPVKVTLPRSLGLRQGPSAQDSPTCQRVIETLLE